MVHLPAKKESDNKLKPLKMMMGDEIKTRAWEPGKMGSVLCFTTRLPCDLENGLILEICKTEITIFLYPACSYEVRFTKMCNVL